MVLSAQFLMFLTQYFNIKTDTDNDHIIVCIGLYYLGGHV